MEDLEKTILEDNNESPALGKDNIKQDKALVIYKGETRLGRGNHVRKHKIYQKGRFDYLEASENVLARAGKHLEVKN